MEGDRERLAAAKAEIESLGRRLRDSEGQAELFRGTVARRDSEIERLRSAAARALERTQVDDCGEATAILEQVVELDGSPVPPRVT